MAGPPDPKKPAPAVPGPRRPSTPSSPSVPAASPPRTTSGEDLALPAMPRYAGPDPRARFALAGVEPTLDVAARVTADAPGGGVRGALPLRLDLPKAVPLPGAAAAFDLDQALARFHDRAYAVARVGPGVDLSDSMESTATGLAKATWKLPRPC